MSLELCSQGRCHRKVVLALEIADRVDQAVQQMLAADKGRPKVVRRRGHGRAQGERVGHLKVRGQALCQVGLSAFEKEIRQLDVYKMNMLKGLYSWLPCASFHMIRGTGGSCAIPEVH